MNKRDMKEALDKLKAGVEFIEDLEDMYSLLGNNEGTSDEAYHCVDSVLRSARLIVADDCLRWFRFVCPHTESMGREGAKNQKVSDIFDHGDTRSIKMLYEHAYITVNGEETTGCEEDEL